MRPRITNYVLLRGIPAGSRTPSYRAPTITHCAPCNAIMTRAHFLRCSSLTPPSDRRRRIASFGSFVFNAPRSVRSQARDKRTWKTKPPARERNRKNAACRADFGKASGGRRREIQTAGTGNVHVSREPETFRRIRCTAFAQSRTRRKPNTTLKNGRVLFNVKLAANRSARTLPAAKFPGRARPGAEHAWFSRERFARREKETVHRPDRPSWL